MLLLKSGADQVTITDQVFAGMYPGTGVGVSADSNGALGLVGFFGAVGSWNINSSTGSVAGGSLTNPDLLLTSFNASSTGAASTALTLMFTQTGYVGAPSGMSFFNSIGGTTEGTITYQTYFSTTNTPFATTTLINNPTINYIGTSFCTSPPAGCCGPFGAFPTTPYSLTEVVTITHPIGVHSTSVAADLSGAPSISQVPEPSSLVLLGSGLLMAGRYTRRKRQ